MDGEGTCEVCTGGGGGSFGAAPPGQGAWASAFLSVKRNVIAELVAREGEAEQDYRLLKQLYDDARAPDRPAGTLAPEG